MSNPLSVLLKATTHAQTSSASGGLIVDLSQRHNVHFVQGKGYMIDRMKIRTQLTGESVVTSRMAQIERGCLGDNYKLTFTPEVDEKKRRCGNGAYAINKGGTWKLTSDDVEMNAYTFAADTGLTMYDPDVAPGGGIVLYETETLTVAAVTFTDTGTYDAQYIRTVQVVSTGQYLHEAGVGDTLVADEFSYTAATKTYTFHSGLEGLDVSVEYTHISTTATDGVVLEDDGMGDPSIHSAILTFLAVDDEDNAQGLVIVEIDGMRNTSAIELGAANQEAETFSREFAIDGVPTFHWVEYA